ncbi:unnamed protein product [Euphydryas editha]|uniref:Seminal fluid protein HACP020 n=1 Tax=Euphydryas editha TaxID=104508 RepID=A0AAU9UM58_EUPED|nr:unnamed protein product [Euphydryas editha]
MKCTVISIKVFVIFLYFSLPNASAEDKGIHLKKSSNNNSKTPLILLLLKKTANSINELDPDNDDVETPGISAVEPPHDQKLYNFYAVLRTTQENEDIDDEADNVFEKTKDVLREALRSRCNRLDTCVQKCPLKKKYTCTLTCKEVYDDYNVCEKPKKKECKKPKCGKTMPPSWLLR